MCAHAASIQKRAQVYDTHMQFAIKDRWEEIKENLREEYELTNISFSNWIAPLKFYKVENDVVTILASDDESMKRIFVVEIGFFIV